MNKRLPFLLFFSILSCLFSIPASAAEGYLTLDLSEGSIQITALGYSIGSKTEFYRGSYLIVQSGAASPHTISITGGSHQITLSNVHINTTGCAFSISPGADVRLQLADGTNNSLQSGPYSAGLQVPTGAALTIQCTYTDQTGLHCENSCGSLDVIWAERLHCGATSYGPRAEVMLPELAVETVPPAVLSPYRAVQFRLRAETMPLELGAAVPPLARSLQLPGVLLQHMAGSSVLGLAAAPSAMAVPF